MGLLPWQAGSDVYNLFNEVKEKYHYPRLEQANIAICFMDVAPFVKDRFNWGKVQKFSNLAKLWHSDHKKYDFLIIICADAWHDILNLTQREALADLLLTRCSVEYEPETVVDPVNNKNVPVKDEWGRVKWSTQVRYDDEGSPKWKVLPLDLNVFTENVRRYGAWCEDILSFKEAIK